MNAVMREQLRRLIDAETRRRRLHGEHGARKPGSSSLAIEAWDATGGDPLLALDYALDALETKRVAAEAAGPQLNSALAQSPQYVAS